MFIVELCDQKQINSNITSEGFLGRVVAKEFSWMGVQFIGFIVKIFQWELSALSWDYYGQVSVTTGAEINYFLKRDYSQTILHLETLILQQHIAFI